jgi:type I restriction enzyme, S subunit
MMKNQLPIGWVTCNLSELLTDVRKIERDLDKNTQIEYVDISAIDNQRNIIGYTKTFPLKVAPSRAKQVIKTGDVLFSLVRPYLKNIAAVPSRLNNQIASTGFCVLRPSCSLNDKFLFFKVVTGDFINLVSGKQYGVSYPAVKEEQIKTQLIDLPPLNEQKRIVAKIEELFSELDNGIAALKTAREQLKVYRQAILKHAFEGKLTAKWRKENADKLETPKQLLSLIQQERDARYQQQLEVWKIAIQEWEVRGNKDKKPSKPKLLKTFGPLPNNVMTDLPELPNSWYWGKLGNLTTGVEYGTSAKSSESGLVSVIRMGNLQNGKIDWADLVYTSDEEEIEKYSLTPNDVLFNRTNSPELVGKTAKYRGEQSALFAGYLIRINQISSIAISDYLNYFLNSHIAKQYGNTVKTDGVNQSNINGEKLQNYPFPFCSIVEQTKIVEILEGKLSLTESSIQEIEFQLAKAETLRQSILKNAFSGKLVPQDPNDEPASELLARIIKKEKKVSLKKRKEK